MIICPQNWFSIAQCLLFIHQKWAGFLSQFVNISPKTGPLLLLLLLLLLLAPLAALYKSGLCSLLLPTNPFLIDCNFGLKHILLTECDGGWILQWPSMREFIWWNDLIKATDQWSVTRSTAQPWSCVQNWILCAFLIQYCSFRWES